MTIYTTTTLFPRTRTSRIYEGFMVAAALEEVEDQEAGKVQRDRARVGRVEAKAPRAARVPSLVRNILCTEEVKVLGRVVAQRGHTVGKQGARVQKEAVAVARNGRLREVNRPGVVARGRTIGRRAAKVQKEVVVAAQKVRPLKVRGRRVAVRVVPRAPSRAVVQRRNGKNNGAKGNNQSGPKGISMMDVLRFLLTNQSHQALG